MCRLQCPTGSDEDQVKDFPEIVTPEASLATARMLGSYRWRPERSLCRGDGDAGDHAVGRPCAHLARLRIRVKHSNASSRRPILNSYADARQGAEFYRGVSLGANDPPSKAAFRRATASDMGALRDQTASTSESGPVSVAQAVAPPSGLTRRSATSERWGWASLETRVHLTDLQNATDWESSLYVR